MKLIIDTDNKTIKLEKTINLGELFSKLQEMFPNDSWKEFSIEVGVVFVETPSKDIQPNFPLWPNPQPNFPQPNFPPWPNTQGPIWLYDPNSQPYYISCSADIEIQPNSGVYLVELKD